MIIIQNCETGLNTEITNYGELLKRTQKEFSQIFIVKTIVFLWLFNQRYIH